MQNILRQAAMHRRVNDSGVEFLVSCFGKKFNDEAGVDWTLPPRNDSVKAHTSEVLRGLGADIYYAPNASNPNADRVPRSQLQTQIPLDGVRLFGNKESPGEVLMLEKGEGIVLNPSACPTTVVTFEGFMDVFHTGRRSLLDEGRIGNKSSGCRFNESVVGTAMRHLQGARNPTGVRVWIFCSVPTTHIPYPLSGNSPWVWFNNQMLDYITRRGWTECLSIDGDIFYIDLPVLAMTQFREEWGVPRQNVDLTSAYWNKEEVDKVWLDGTSGTPRNLKVVVRYN